LKNKFWNRVEISLIEEKSLYFVGRTLCVDFDKGGIGLNLNGKGFLYGGRDQFRRNSNVYLPDYITKMVQKIYFEKKVKVNV
jgi:hypothetical protein